MSKSELAKQLKTKSDYAYLRYISLMRSDLCLGVDIKLELGRFGTDELGAHTEAGRQLGKHQAYHEAMKMIVEADEVI